MEKELTKSDNEEKRVKIVNAAPVNMDANAYKNFDYEFILKINTEPLMVDGVLQEETEHIICQRYFHIRDFNKKSLSSMDLKWTFDDIVDLIKSDLKIKTLRYMYHVVSPFQDEGILKEYQDAGYYKSQIWSKNTGEFDPATKEKLNEPESFLTFEFRVNKAPVMVHRWSADIYPSFIRNSIDIANSQYLQITPTFRLKFEDVDEMAIKYEQSIRKNIHQYRENLIPKIISLFRDVCALESNDYKNVFDYYSKKKNKIY
jgi:hypothetical protein